MSVVSQIFVLAGVGLVLLAAIGLLRLRTPYARLHAAGKASPVAFLLVAVAAGIETGWLGAARLAVAGAALIVTLPIAVHVLFRAVHSSEPDHDPPLDELGRSPR